MTFLCTLQWRLDSETGSGPRYLKDKRKKKEGSGPGSACLCEISLPGIGSSAGQRPGSGARERSFASEACKVTSPTSKYRKVSLEGRPPALGYDMEDGCT